MRRHLLRLDLQRSHHILLFHFLFINFDLLSLLNFGQTCTIFLIPLNFILFFPIRILISILRCFGQRWHKILTRLQRCKLPYPLLNRQGLLSRRLVQDDWFCPVRQKGAVMVAWEPCRPFYLIVRAHFWPYLQFILRWGSCLHKTHANSELARTIRVTEEINLIFVLFIAVFCTLGRGDVILKAWCLYSF